MGRTPSYKALLAALASLQVVTASITNVPDELNGQAFDYVIVGGGAAGLTLARRLLEDSSLRVAVIEAGNSGEDVMTRILVPAMTYTDGIVNPGSVNDWDYWTETLGKWRHQPRGKVLGGSTAVNALYVVRASAIEHDAWNSLHEDPLEDWGWDTFHQYMMKSETYHPPDDPSFTGSIDLNFHGDSGPVQVSYPQYVYEATSRWVDTVSNLGLKTSDPQGGEGWGGYVSPMSIDPVDGTRSYAKTAYLDPVADNSRLSVLLEHQAIKILFDTSGRTPRATGVQFQRSPDDPVYEVYVRHEVILSAGVFGTPHLLELSGIGSRSLLESKGIEVVADLPGVGEHFQDHVLVPLVWSAPNETITGDLLTRNDGFKEEQLNLFLDGALDQSMLSTPNNAIGYVNLRDLMGDSAADQFLAGIRANITDVLDNQVYPEGDDTVRAGYELTYSTEVEQIIDSDVGVVEILLGSFGSWNQVNATVSIQVAIQHPMSRGSVHLNTTSPWDNPIIIANYLNTDSDWDIMRAGVRYLRRLAATEPMSSLIVEELMPGANITTDREIDDYIWEMGSTQYRPASTSSMLPLERGGVVDTDLKVYKVDGLRVIDSSVIPIGLCAHLMQPTYAIAEKGADIIKSKPIEAREVSSALRTGAGGALGTQIFSMGLTGLMGVLAMGSWIV